MWCRQRRIAVSDEEFGWRRPRLTSTLSGSDLRGSAILVRDLSVECDRDPTHTCLETRGHFWLRKLG